MKNKMDKTLFDLSGQVAVVTGASSGLGVQFALALARQGADVALMARRVDKLNAVADQVRALGVRALAIPCDVTDPTAVASALAQVQTAWGRVDILINNAGTGGSAPAEQLDDAAWRKVIEVDLTGVFTVAREAGKIMLEQGYGRIVNVASMYGLVGNRTIPTAAYHAAKGGVVNLTRALAAEWAGRGVTVNTLCPGFFASEMTEAVLDTPFFAEYMRNFVPMGRYGKPGELDSALIFLSAPASSYVTGVALAVDGGYTAI